MNTVKEKLAKLLEESRLKIVPKGNRKFIQPADSMEIADHLIQNGVTLIPETGIGEMSDGYHTFNELYHHRALLFATICNMHPEKAWKSKKHDDGSMYDGMFIVGIETVSGQATYHYDIEPYWDMFRVRELEKAPVWDGHTPEEALQRITTLQDADKWVSVDEPPVARPLEEWHEDYGVVLWWKFPIEEPPYVGGPLDLDWPGYHTHWTPISPLPEPPKGVQR